LSRSAFPANNPIPKTAAPKRMDAIVTGIISIIPAL
jgi:hypothetical protein